jgi:raffinose/stachyose/melibiose transport system permease protein
MLFLLPVVLLYCAFFLYPLVFVFVTGCTSWNGIKAMSFTGLSNYIKLFGNGTFRLSLRNNFIWAFALAFIQVPLATITAMILARKPRGWRFLRTVYFLPNVISQVAIAMMWMALYNAEYGILNHFLSAVGLASWTHNWLGEIGTALPAVIAQQVLYIGYFMIIILAGILSIPDSLYEAAEMDGAGVLRQELYVTLPMIRGLLVTSMTLAVAYGLRHFEATYLMTNGGPANSTSVLGLLLYKKMGALDYGQANAIGSVLVLTGVLLIIFIRRIFGRVEAASETVQ